MTVQKNACCIILQIKIGTSSHFIRLSGSVRTSFSECGANLSGMSCPKMISSTVFIFSGSSIASLNKNLSNRLSFENPFLLLICFAFHRMKIFRKEKCLYKYISIYRYLKQACIIQLCVNGLLLNDYPALISNCLIR